MSNIWLSLQDMLWTQYSLYIMQRRIYVSISLLFHFLGGSIYPHNYKSKFTNPNRNTILEYTYVIIFEDNISEEAVTYNNEKR